MGDGSIVEIGFGSAVEIDPCGFEIRKDHITAAVKGGIGGGDFAVDSDQRFSGIKGFSG